MNILEEIQNCPVEWKELKDIAILKNGKDWKTLPSGEVPVYGSGGEMGEFVSEYSYDKPTVLIPRKGSISNLFYLENAFWNVDTIYYTEIDDKQIIPKYFFYYLTTIKLEEMATNPTRPSLTQAILDKVKIPIPPLEIQEKIVQTLDKFTDYVTELTSELTSRKKQYSFYRDKLLSFEDEVYQVEWKTLSEIAKDFGRGKSKHRPRNDARLYGGDIPFIQTGDIREAGKWIKNYSQTYSAFGVEQSKKWEKGTLCITIAANIAETGLLGFEACFPDSIIGFVANPEFAITEYVYYYLNSIKDYLANKSYGSAQDNLNLSTFSSLKIPVPSLEIQSRIVQVLDNFDTVCNDLNIGLPKEIELRQKQYEYFRDKLLTFVAEGEYTDSTVQTRHH